MKSAMCCAVTALSAVGLMTAAQVPASGLRPGTYDAGFRVMQTWDRGRARVPPADFSGRRAGSDIAVPVQVAVWYPAVRSQTARPMSMLDLRLVGVHDAEHGRIDATDRFAAPSATDSSWALDDAVRIARRVSAGDTARAELRRDALAALSLASYRDAAPARGSFPVAVVEGDASITNTSVLAEYLATHGWIVIVTASRTSASIPLEASEQRIPIEMGVRGIEHAVGVAFSVPSADPSRLVVIGVNFAGLAALEYQNAIHARLGRRHDQWVGNDR